jgi:hypothetical protein
MFLGLLITSEWCWASYSWDNGAHRFDIDRGIVSANRSRDKDDRVWGGPFEWGLHHPVEREPPFAWWFDWRFTRFGSYIQIPLWFPPILLFPAAIAISRSDARKRHRNRMNYCVNCNYDRRGIGTWVPCPECGAAAPGVCPPNPSHS